MRGVCDHDPARPVLELARPVPALPPPIERAIDRSSRVYTHHAEFPAFRFLRGLDKTQRSERREAIALVLKAELVRLDLASWRVGTPIEDSPNLAGLAVASLCAWTGLSRSRVERAIADITRAGYQRGKRDKRGRLCAPQPIETRTDPSTGERTYRGQAAVRVFEPRIWIDLGVALEMDAATKRARARRKERAASAAAAAERTRAAAVAREMDRVLHARTRAAGRPIGPPPVEGQRAVEIALEVHREHPHWSVEDQRAEVARRLAGTGPPE